MSIAGNEYLPGGLSRRTARRFLPRPNPFWSGVTLPLTAAGLAVGFENVPLAVIFGGLALLALASSLRRTTVRVSPGDQPELWELVETVARRLGVAPPRRLLLVHQPELSLDGHNLRLGLPLVRALEADDLAALLAHELAHTTFPRGSEVLTLAKQWRAVAKSRLDEDAKPDDRATEAELRTLGLAVERVADEAAVAAAGIRQRAARAIAVAEQLTWSYRFDFIADLEVPARRLVGLTAVALEDIDDVWRRFLDEGVEVYVWDEDEAASVAARHPPLAEELLRLTEAELTVTAPRSPVRLRPLDQRARRRLARQAFKVPALVWVRWFTVETAPPSWWQARAERAADGVRESAARVLGRDPRDHEELIEVLLLRNREVIQSDPVLARLGIEAVDDADATQPRVLVDIVEEALFARGWRLHHPAVRGVLVSPRGERVDARRLVAMRSSPAALDEVRTILNS